MIDKLPSLICFNFKADKSLNVVWLGSFLVIFGVSINWGLTVELVIKVSFSFGNLT